MLIGPSQKEEAASQQTNHFVVQQPLYFTGETPHSIFTYRIFWHCYQNRAYLKTLTRPSKGKTSFSDAEPIGLPKGI